MKKQFLCLLLALILAVGLLPVTALADTAKPEAKFDFILSGEEMPEDTEAALVMKAGDEAKYYATKQTDPSFPANWYLTPGTATEWNVKFEYPADGIPTITLKDAKIINKHGLWFGGINMPMTSDVKVIVEGTNHLEYVSNADTVLPAYGALMLRTTGTATVVGPGKLNFVSDHHSRGAKAVTSGVLACDGDLVLENIEIFMSMPDTKGKSNGICTTGGNVTMKGGSLTIVAYDDPKTLHDPGQETGFRRNQEAIHSAVFIKKTAAGTGGNFTVQDGAKVLIMASPYKNTDNKGRLMYTEGTFTIKDSTVEIGLVGKIPTGISLFDKKPTLEYANNTYTVSSTSITYPKYTHGELTLTPAQYDLIDYLSDNVMLSTLTYFKVAPGGPGGPHCELPPVVTPPAPEPTTPAPTEPAPTTPAPTEPKPTTPASTESKPTTPAPTEPAPTEPAPTEKEPGDALVIWVIVICALLVAGSGFALYWFVFRNKKK